MSAHGGPAISARQLTRKFGANVDTEPVRVAYRETITRPVSGVEGRHKKQTGGHGQFGVCVIDVEPLPRGEGFAFASTVVGGAISRSYIGAIQKGIEEAMASGGVYGYPVVDVGVTVTDGKERTVSFLWVSRSLLPSVLDRIEHDLAESRNDPEPPAG